MKHVDEYHDAALAKALFAKIHQAATRPIRLMEICGTHTMAIFRHGIRSLLPENIELVSGPGCPVCVTAMEEVDRSIKLARYPEVILTTFGDMLRVPGSASSLDREKGKGADVRMVYSTFDAIRFAERCPDKEVVFLGIGFETTAPTVAAAIAAAREKGLSNFSVLSAHKLLPPAMHALLSADDISIDGFICPGHVTTVIGTSAYNRIVAEYAIPCVVVGFEPIDILQGILMLAEQVASGRATVEIQYTRGASQEGNQAALRLMDRIFEPCDAPWRGLGLIRKSGLAIRKTYDVYDAAVRFDVSVPPADEPPGCLCAQVLRGTVRPPDCRLFRKVCSPRTPVGPCMVSSEGTCAAYFKYHGE